MPNFCTQMYARNGTNLYVSIKLPISHFQKSFKKYQIKSLPVPVNATFPPPHATQLLDLPSYFVISHDQQYYATLNPADLNNCVGQEPIYCKTNFPLIPVTTKSCLLALFANDKDQVISKCDFRFVHDIIQPHVIKISSHSVVLYRTSLVAMECANDHKMVKGCDFCIFNIPCKCSISPSTFYMASSLAGCHLHDKSANIMHPVNLALLQHFFDASFVKNIFADTTFQTAVNVSIPNMKFFSHDMSDVIAADKKAHLSLAKLAKARKNDAVIFQSLSEPLLDGTISLDDNWPSVDNILIYCSIGMIILLTIVSFGVVLKLRKVAIILATLQHSKSSTAMVTKVPSFIYEKSPPASEENFTDLNIELSFDHANFILLWIMILFLMIWIVKLYKSRRTSKLFLEVTNESQNVFIEIMALPICQTCFKVHVPFDINNLMVHETFKPTLTVSWSNFSVQNLTTNQIVSVPHEIPISIFTAIKLHKILQQPYHVFVYQKHHSYTITPLRQN